MKEKLPSCCSKRPVKNITSASTSTSQDDNGVVVAHETPSPTKSHWVIRGEKVLIMKMPAECVIWPTMTQSGKLNGKQYWNYWANQIQYGTKRTFKFGKIRDEQ